VFEVDAGGERIHSKKQTGKFPEHETVLAALHQQIG